MYYVSYDQSRRVWNLAEAKGRYSTTFDSAIVTPKGGEFEDGCLVKLQALHGLVMTPEVEAAIAPNETLHRLAMCTQRLSEGMGRRTVQLNPDGTWESYRV